MDSNKTNRSLRVGVVFAGKVVAEQVFDTPRDISVGSHPTCTVAIDPQHTPGLPDRLPVLRFAQGRWFAVLPDAAHELKVRSAAGLATGVPGEVIRDGQVLVPLAGVAGGSLLVGELVVMFQWVRPEAVPLVTVRKPVLRVGLVCDDRLLAEHVFEPGTAVTVGAQRNDTLVLPDVEYCGAPVRFGKGKSADRVRVSVPVGTGLRMAGDGAVLDEAQAVRQGLATSDGQRLEFELLAGNRGRCTLGPYTLLFQVVVQATAVAVFRKKPWREHLAQLVLGEPTWTASLMLSFLLLGSVVAQAHVWYLQQGRFANPAPAESVQTVDWLPEQAIAVQPEPEVEPKAEPAPSLQPAPAPVKAAAKAAAKNATKAAAARPERGLDPPTAAPRAVGLARTVAGAFAPKSKFWAQNDDAGGDVPAQHFGQNVPRESVWAETSTPHVAIAATGTAAKVKTTAANFGQRDQAATHDTAAPKAEKTITIVVGPPVGPEDSKADVGKALRNKNGAVQRCYEQELRTNPGADGKVRVTFTVGTEGTVTDVSVAGVSGGLADCISGIFQRIRGLPRLVAPGIFSQTYLLSQGK